jgi:hypothetical protein
MIKINASRAIELLRAEVAGNEDYVYGQHHNECVYVDDGQACCLVGKVLNRAGVPIAQLADMDHMGDTAIDDLFKEGNLDHILNITASAVNVLASAQHAQDDDFPWDYALAMAESKYDEVKDV